MFAIVEIAGIQYEVEPNEILTVPLLDAEVGESVEFNNILCVGDNENTKIGAPYVEGSIKAVAIDHGRGDKVIVFHKKRRKGHRKLNGHRQYYTQIEITDFLIPGFEFKTEVEAPKPKEEPKFKESAVEDVVETFDAVENDEIISDIDSEIEAIDEDSEKK